MIGKLGRKEKSIHGGGMILSEYKKKTAIIIKDFIIKEAARTRVDQKPLGNEFEAGPSECLGMNSGSQSVIKDDPHQHHFGR